MQTFVKNYKAKYNEEPDSFAAGAYDTMVLFSHVIKQYGPERKAIRDGLAQIKDVPSVIFGKVVFDPETRRISGPKSINLIVKNGAFVLWDGSKPAVASK